MHRKPWLLIPTLFLLVLNACAAPASPTPLLLASPTMAISEVAPVQEITPTLPNDIPTEPPRSTETPAPTPSPTPEPVTLLEVEASQLTGVAIQFWHSFSGARERLLSEWADTFNASNTYGITVELARQDSLFNTVRDAIRAGSPPHLTIAFTNQAAAWDLAGAPPGSAFVDLTPYMTDPVYGYADDEMADFYSAFLEQETVDGKLIGFPTYRSAQVMFYNVTWAQELGFQAPPTTPDEFNAQSCAASQARVDGTGGWFVNTDTATTLSWIFAFEGQILSPEGGYTFNTPEATAAFGFIRELYAEGCAWRPEPTFPNAEFATRQGLFYSSGLNGLFFQQQAFEEAGSTDQWTMIPFPSPDGQPVTHIFGPAYNVFKTTPEGQLAAWLFIQWVSSPANQARWTEISGSYPTRASAIEYLNPYIAGLPQWTRAYDLVPRGKNEPSLPSWGTVRWVVSDAAAQLFGFGFSADKIPGILEELERTANEVGG